MKKTSKKPRVDIYYSKVKGKVSKGSNVFKAWKHITEGCVNPHAESYVYYGYYGIKCSDRWLDVENGFNNFKEDVGKPLLERCWLERINMEGDFVPGNTVWMTLEQRAELQRKKRIDALVVRGVKYLPESNLWVATIKRYGEREFLGAFKDKEEAIIHREAAEIYYAI